MVTMQKGHAMKRASQLMMAVMTVVALAGCQISGHTVPIKEESGKAAVASATSQTRVQEGYGALPLSFEANLGQTDPRVQFLARGKGYTLFLTPNEAVFSLRKAKVEVKGEYEQTVLRMRLEGANPSPGASGLEPLPGIVNYFIGNNPQNWRTNIPTYKKVEYNEVYPGIDLAYYGNQGKLEYDLIVAPGADPSQIKLAFEGAQAITLADSGDLILTTDIGDVRLQKPLVYQLDDKGHRMLVAGSYVVPSERPSSESELPAIGIQLASYDRSKPVVIDPMIIYSTYLGGSDQEVTGRPDGDFKVDGAGNAYVTGFTQSTNFPASPGAFQTTFGGGQFDVFVTKLNPSGSALVYSTYLGGSSFDEVHGLAVDSGGNAYVAGETASSNFPTTPGAFQTTFSVGLGNAFVTKLDPIGAPVYSTYISGSQALAITLDAAGNAYITGAAGPGLPTTPSAFQTTFGGGAVDCFVTKLNATGSALVYSTYLGGSGAEGSADIAVDAAGNAYVTGVTASDFPPNSPTTPGTFQTASAGSPDVLVTKLNPTGSAPTYSTYVGGSSSEGVDGLAVDSAGNAYITGRISSTDFPTTPGAFQTTFGGIDDDYVRKQH